LFDPNTSSAVGARVDQSGRYHVVAPPDESARAAAAESFVLLPSGLVRGAPFTEQLLAVHRQIAARTIQCAPRLSQRGYDEWSMNPAPRFAILLRANSGSPMLAQVRPVVSSAFSQCVEGQLRTLSIAPTGLCGDLWIEFPEDWQVWIYHTQMFDPRRYQGAPLAGWPIELAPGEWPVFELVNGRLVASDRDPFDAARRIRALNEWWIQTSGSTPFDAATAVFVSDASAP
jgi:hypothetical protein